MFKVKVALVSCLAAVLLGGVAWGQTVNPTGLAWDANSEADLAGYFVYEATSAGSYTVGTYAVSVPAGTTTFNFSDGPAHADGTYYWVVTAFDTAGNESGFSNEVSATFNQDAPVPPTGCRVVY